MSWTWHWVKRTNNALLLFVEVISRTTRDIDVITPELDPLLQNLANEIGKRYGLASGWLNNGPASLVRELQPGWRDRTTPIYQGEFLVLESLGRSDLLASKLFALCDRDEQDLEDILEMKASWPEIEGWKTWLLERDGSIYWPERVRSRLATLKRKIGHE
ncbi:MAG: DUF6036 family nucleotidyltransferase [Oligoflexia bacterium]